MFFTIKEHLFCVFLYHDTKAQGWFSIMRPKAIPPDRYRADKCRKKTSIIFQKYKKINPKSAAILSCDFLGEI